MKRYTYKRDHYGDDIILSENIYPCYVNEQLVSYYGQAIDRLSDYEDTGLTPEQIKEMDMLYLEKCKELAKYKKLYNDELPCKVSDEKDEK